MRRLMIGVAALVVLTVVAMASTEVRAVTVWDATADFSGVNNPNGAWSYGERSIPNSTAFTPLLPYFAPPGNPSGYYCWININNGDSIAENTTNADMTGGTLGTVLVPAHTLTMSPGFESYALYPVLRWTAPAAGLYSIQGTFAGSDTAAPTTTDVHLVYNGQPDLWFGNVNGYGDPSIGFSGFLQNVNAGDFIDVCVGNGGNGTPFDTTRVTLTITPVPEPSTFVLLGMGAVGLLAYVWRRRKAMA